MNLETDARRMHTPARKTPLSVQVATVGIWLVSFPVIGLQRTDAAGLEKLPFTSPTFLLQGAWTALCFLGLVVVLLNSKRVWQSKTFALIFAIVATCFLSTVASIIFNSAGDTLSWLRTAQYFSVVGLAVLSISIIVIKCGIDYAGSLFASAIKFYFFFALAAILILYFVDAEMAFPAGTGARGPRLGGSVVHPNTLALGAVLFLCANDLGRKRGKFSNFLSIMIPVVVIVLTGSTSGLLLLAMWVAFTFFRRNKLTRILYIVPLVVVFYGCILVLPFLLVLDSSQGVLSDAPGTWSDRLVIYQAAAYGVMHNPVFGVGAFEGVSRFFEQNFPFRYLAPAHSHNYVFDALLSRGLLGGLSYIFVGMYGGYVAARHLFDRDRGQGTAPMTAMIFVTVFTQGLMESSVVGAVKPFAHVGLFVSLSLMIWMKRWAHDHSVLGPSALTEPSSNV